MYFDFSALDSDGTCSSDSDCPLSFYHCCSGNIWCCPSGYICTGTATCISIGAIVGPIVGLIAIIVYVVVCCICYKKRQQTPGVVYNPQTTQPGYGQPQAYGQPQTYGQPQPYGQPQAYGQPCTGKSLNIVCQRERE
ncbi:uncharacterized protein LOC133174621 [Saccostrea echinata]|uniref:uncharacterized protein LOC133174621 n=1 Tax=Saccostrea echinata TaxID=191078 RepID=UPI002A805E66|nr:uncharacterized protein LOC133174621 [Saccostrea echinata]